MSEKILLIEGENKLREHYRDLLESSGYNVISASSGKNGLRKCRHEPVDVIVMDVALPDGRGFEYLRKMMAERRGVKVVIHTEHAGYKSDFNSWIADAFVTKSDDPSELQTTIHNVLNPN
jgi:DNA-binding response OmpR family regulator